MIRLLDYYYLVLLRYYDNCYKKDRLSYRVTGVMSATFAVNLFSLVVLFNHHILEQGAFWIAFFAIGLVIMTALDIIYNKKRRERIRQEYKRESRKSRRCGVFWVVGYEILSFAFLIWIFSLLAKFYSP